MFWAERKANSREAWLRRLQLYWKFGGFFPRFTSRVGEIYEVDFGENVGTEFSGRHLAVCLQDSIPEQDQMLVIPITTKFMEYNVQEEDMVHTISTTSGAIIEGGVALRQARWISKKRIFLVSKILEDNDDVKCYVKGSIEVSNPTLRRWLKIKL